MSEQKIKAIFLDVGGPIVDDSAIDPYWNNYLKENLPGIIGREVTLEEIEEANRQSVACYAPSTYSFTIWHFVQPDIDAFWKLRKHLISHTFIPFYKFRPEAVEVCRELSQDYTLAIAANQHNATVAYLEEKGLLQYFTFKEMSEAIAYSKPDLRFFMYIADKLRIPLNQCVMVGDRQDNDIVPAKKLKMKAIRYRTGLHKDQKIRLPMEMPDAEIFSLNELPAVINDLQNSIN